MLWNKIKKTKPYSPSPFLTNPLLSSHIRIPLSPEISSSCFRKIPNQVLFLTIVISSIIAGREEIIPDFKFSRCSYFQSLLHPFVIRLVPLSFSSLKKIVNKKIFDMIFETLVSIKKESRIIKGREGCDANAEKRKEERSGLNFDVIFKNSVSIKRLNLVFLEKG